MDIGTSEQFNCCTVVVLRCGIKIDEKNLVASSVTNNLKLKLTLPYNNLINKKSVCPTSCIGSKKSLIACPPINQI